MTVLLTLLEHDRASFAALIIATCIVRDIFLRIDRATVDQPTWDAALCFTAVVFAGFVVVGAAAFTVAFYALVRLRGLL